MCIDRPAFREAGLADVLTDSWQGGVKNIVQSKLYPITSCAHSWLISIVGGKFNRRYFMDEMDISNINIKSFSFHCKVAILGVSKPTCWWLPLQVSRQVYTTHELVFPLTCLPLKIPCSCWSNFSILLYVNTKFIFVCSSSIFLFILSDLDRPLAFRTLSLLSWSQERERRPNQAISAKVSEIDALDTTKIRIDVISGSAFVAMAM